MAKTAPATLETEEFHLEELDNNIFMLRENYYTSWNQPNIWVLKGAERDLIIDTGIGLWDLPGFLKKNNIIGEKPYEAVATHIHFDHTGGAHQFEKFSIHRLEGDAIEKGNQYVCCSLMTAKEIARPPTQDWRAQNYKVLAAKPSRLLEDGDLFDLGDRQLRVIHLPGHTVGSIALYEENTKSLFSGDVAYIGPLLDVLPTSNVTHYIQTAQKLRELAPNVDKVYPGHGVVFDGSTLDGLMAEYIASKQACCAGVQVTCGTPVVSCLLKGRNSSNLAAACCWKGCCCYYCMQCKISTTPH